MIYSISIVLLGTSFIYGFNIGMYNIPLSVIIEFFDQVHIERYGVPMNHSMVTMINSMINGLLPLGGIFGSILSGQLAEKYGR